MTGLDTNILVRSDEPIAARCQEGGCAKLATFDKALAKRHGAFAFIPKAK